MIMKVNTLPKILFEFEKNMKIVFNTLITITNKRNVYSL